MWYCGPYICPTKNSKYRVDLECLDNHTSVDSSWVLSRMHLVLVVVVQSSAYHHHHPFCISSSSIIYDAHTVVLAQV